MGSNFVWNSINYIFLTHNNSNYTSWDDLSLIEEYQRIEPIDISSEVPLAKKVFRNHILSKIMQQSLKPQYKIITEGDNVSRVEFYTLNQQLFVLSTLQRLERLEIMFNWHIAAVSMVRIIDVIEIEVKKEWIQPFNKIINQLNLKELISSLKDCQTVEKDIELRIQMCKETLDKFIDNTPKIISRSLLLFSDVNIFGEFLLECNDCLARGKIFIQIIRRFF